jgi:hypothetical protein
MPEALSPPIPDRECSLPLLGIEDSLRGLFLGGIDADDLAWLIGSKYAVIVGVGCDGDVEGLCDILDSAEKSGVFLVSVRWIEIRLLGA